VIHALTWAVFTAVLSALTIAVWARMRSVSVILGLLLIYYFSLYGSAFIIMEQLGIETGMRFKSLATKLIYPNLDTAYWLTMFGYFLFTVSVIGGLLGAARASPTKPKEPIHIKFNFLTLATLAFIAQCTSLYLIKDHLVEIAIGNATGYEIFSSIETNWAYSLSKALREIGTTAAFAGFGAYWATQQYTPEARSRLAVAGLLLNILLATSLSIVTGDKHELLTSILAGIAAFSLLGGRFQFAQIVSLVSLSIAIFALIEGTRGTGLLANNSDSLGESLITGMFDTITSNEAFAAHLSLYGIFKYDLPVHWGSGFVDFVLSIPPRFLGLPRPEGIYQIYVEGIFAKIGQGFTIHHAAAWYLNLSWLGFILGGLILGSLWGSAVDLARRSRRNEHSWQAVLAFAMPVAILGYLPSLLRAAIETYKGFTVFALGIFLIFFISSRRGQHHAT
jgi:hypothetical protein